MLTLKDGKQVFTSLNYTDFGVVIIFKIMKSGLSRWDHKGSLVSK